MYQCCNIGSWLCLEIGLVGLLKTNGVNYLAFQRSIHQQKLCSKALQMRDIMSTVPAIVNIIRAGNKVQKHRKFVQFLKDLNATYELGPLYSKIRLLSPGKTLQRFFFMRKKIILLCEMKLK